MKHLTTWFTIHFVVDFLFAIPLFLAPVRTLTLFGWTTVDPIVTRLIATSLFGIGGISLLHRNADKKTMRALLDLKLIWAGSAIIGLCISIYQGAPPLAWILVLLFSIFFAVWLKYYRETR